MILLSYKLYSYDLAPCIFDFARNNSQIEFLDNNLLESARVRCWTYGFDKEIFEQSELDRALSSPEFRKLDQIKWLESEIKFHAKEKMLIQNITTITYCVFLFVVCVYFFNHLIDIF